MKCCSSKKPIFWILPTSATQSISVCLVSVIRGEEREGSDIDLLVDFLPGSTLLDQVSLIDALSTKLGRKVDVVSERALNKYLRQRVLQEAVAL
jgi:uncharacterized protein